MTRAALLFRTFHREDFPAVRDRHMTARALHFVLGDVHLVHKVAIAVFLNVLGLCVA